MTLETRLSKLLLVLAAAIVTAHGTAGVASANGTLAAGPAVGVHEFVVPVTAPPGRSGALAPTRTGSEIDELTGLPSVYTAPPAATTASPSALPAAPSPAPAPREAAATPPAPALEDATVPPLAPASVSPEAVAAASPPALADAPAAAALAGAAAAPVLAGARSRQAAAATPRSVDIHETGDKNKVEVQVDRGGAGPSESVELDLPSLEDEKAKIKEAVPEAADTVADAEPEFDIPIVMNRKVERWIEYFQTVGRKHMVVWLARSERYIPMMQAVLKEKGLPSDLVYLALIESGFSTRARSHAAAVGPWQFIAGTARRYGLRIDWWIDERQDPEKSTIAAANYLSDLHDMFNSWYLAAAGYNAGEHRIVRAIARFDTDDFWEIAERRYLARETKDYVPKLIAAALIAKSPEKYGFTDIAYQEPLVYDKVEVPDATDLAVIARAAETTYEEIKALNPELRRWATPPNYAGYQVKIPLGKQETFARNFGRIAPSERITYRRHVVRSGETLLRIGSRYGVDIDQIRRMNGLRGSLIRVGQSLVVPIPTDRTTIARGYDGDREVKPGRRTVAASRRAPARISAHGESAKAGATRHLVRRGETLWDIGVRYGVTVADLRRWNNLSPRHVLKAGESLIVMASGSVRTIGYRVRRGDTLSGIAERYDVSVADLRRWNNFSRRDVLKAGERIVIKVADDS